MDSYPGPERQAAELLVDRTPVPAKPSLRPAPFTLLGSGPLDPSLRPSGPRNTLAPGSQFGVYSIGACIGEGGMARIYRAEHEGLRRQVAIKVLIDDVTRGQEGRERFLREARIAAAIKHPNVVNIFDVGVQDETAYLVMELLEGTDLESLLASKGALDEGMIIDIMVPIIAGLAAVHDAGIVHRDLKPGNIFLARGRYEDLEPKLLDFGISKAPGPEQLRLTTNGMLMGTPFYMSPEGLRGEEMTPLSDQYSLGVVIYECATGSPPFEAGTFAEVHKLITAGRYTPPNTKVPVLSKRLSRIIMRAMSLVPEERYKDLREMGRELLTLAGQRTRITWALSFGDVRPPATLASGGVPSGGTLSTPPAEPPHEATRNRRKLVILALPVLALAAGLVLWLSSDTSPPPLEAVAPITGAPPPQEPATPAQVQAPAPAPTFAPETSSPSPPAAKERADEASERSSPRSAPRLRVWSSRPADAQQSTEGEADWALPASGAPATSPPNRPGQPRVAAGSNGAPIFD